MSGLNKCKADAVEKGSEFSNSSDSYLFIFLKFLTSTLLHHKVTSGEEGPVYLKAGGNRGREKRDAKKFRPTQSACIM